MPCSASKHNISFRTLQIRHAIYWEGELLEKYSASALSRSTSMLKLVLKSPLSAYNAFEEIILLSGKYHQNRLIVYLVAMIQNCRL